MNVLISSYYFDLSGTPTYTKTLYNELVRRGHSVTIYSPVGGKLAEGLNVVGSLSGVAAPDVIIAQQNVCAEQMRQKFPTVPMVYSAHHATYELEQPPQCEVQWWTAINEEVRDNLIAKGVKVDKISIIRDFVDTKIFKREVPVAYSLRRVLYISNYKKWKTYDVIEKACKKLNVRLKAIGAPYGRSYAVQDDINAADVVISIARGILEAMACERPCISFDKMKGDGYITEEVYYESRKHQFGYDLCKHEFTADGLAEEMAKFDCLDGGKNRELILAHHDVKDGATRLLAACERAMAA